MPMNLKPIKGLQEITKIENEENVFHSPQGNINLLNLLIKKQPSDMSDLEITYFINPMI